MKKLFNFRLALFVAISLCLGILITYCFCRVKVAMGIVLLTVFCVCLTLFVFVFTKKGNRWKSLAFSLVFIAVTACGGLRFYIQIEQYNRADLANHYYDVSGKITQVSDTDYGVKYILSDVNISGDIDGKLLYKVEVYVYDKLNYDLGDYVELKGHLMDKPLYYDERFSAYSLESGVKYSMSANGNDIRFVKSSPDIFQKTNLLIKRTLKQSLSEDSFAVAYALLTGNSDYIDVDTLTSYRQAGVAHIFAVSGLHIGFLATLINFIFKKIKCHGIVKACITTLTLFFYSGVCGFTASSIRASVMCAVLSFVTVGGNKYDGISGWSIAGIIILLISPVQLFCAGFELSFAVVFGILTLAKPLARLFKFLPKKLADSIGTVLSAQIFGAPICVMLFGEASLVAIILNLIFIPVVSVLFTLTLVSTFFCAVFGLNGIVFFLIEYIYRAINYVITFLDYNFFMMGGIALGGCAISYYLVALIAGGFVNVKRKVKIITCVALSAIFILSTAIYNIEINGRSYVYLSGSSDVCFTLIDTPQAVVGVVSDVDGYFSVSRLKRISTYNKIDSLDLLVMSGGTEKYLMSTVANIRTVFKLDRVAYFGDADNGLEIAFNKSFPEYCIENYSDARNIVEFDCLTVNYNVCGRVVESLVNGNKIGLFSRLDIDGIKYSDLPNDYYLAVFSNNADIIVNAVKPQNAISFRENSSLDNAERGGNVRLLMR